MIYIAITTSLKMLLASMDTSALWIVTSKWFSDSGQDEGAIIPSKIVQFMYLISVTEEIYISNPEALRSRYYDAEYLDLMHVFTFRRVRHLMVETQSWNVRGNKTVC